MKEISVLLIIVVILVGILGFKIYTSQDNQMSIGENKATTEISKDDNKEYSREEIIKLMESGENYNNYYYKSYLGDDYTIRKFKDNKLYIESIDEENKQIVYQDFSNNEYVGISKEKNTAIVSTLDSTKIIALDKLYYKQLMEIVKNTKYSYKFLGTENHNTLECVVISIRDIQDSNYKIWIHKESGLVARYLLTNKLGEDDINFELKLDCVTDKDVKKPNLDGYKIMNID